MKVDDVVVGPRDFARHAGGLMDDFDLAMLPVVDHGVVLGVVTRADVLRGKEGVCSPYVQQVMSQRQAEPHEEGGHAAEHG